MPISVKHDLSILILHKILIQTSPSPFNPKHFKRTKVKTETRKHYNLRNREGFKLKAKIDDKRQGPCPALTRGLKLLLLSPSPSSFSGDSKVMRFRTCNVDTSHANNIKDGGFRFALYLFMANLFTYYNVNIVQVTAQQLLPQNSNLCFIIISQPKNNCRSLKMEAPNVQVLFNLDL